MLIGGHKSPNSKKTGDWYWSPDARDERMIVCRLADVRPILCTRISDIFPNMFWETLISSVFKSTYEFSSNQYFFFFVRAGPSTAFAAAVLGL